MNSPSTSVNLKNEKVQILLFCTVIKFNSIQFNDRFLSSNPRPCLSHCGTFGTFGPLHDNSGNQFYLNLTNVLSLVWLLPMCDYAYWFFPKSDYCHGSMAHNQCSPKLLLAAEGSSCPHKYLSGNAQLSRHRPLTSAPAGAPFCWSGGWLISAYLTPTLLTDTGDW